MRLENILYTTLALALGAPVLGDAAARDNAPSPTRFSLEARTTQAEETILSVLTANLWLLPTRSIDDEKRLTNFISYVKKTEPDIATLQEIWRHKNVYDLKEALPEYHVITANEGLLFNESGLVTLVKKTLGPFPNSYFKEFEIDTRSLVGWVADKGYLTVNISINGREYIIGNTHLHASLTNDSPIAIGQFNELQKVPNISLLAGDVNLNPQVFDNVNDAFKTDKTGNTYSSHNPYTSLGSNRRNAPVDTKIDRILIPHDSNAVLLDARVVKNPPVSDHYMIAYNVAFK